MAVRHGWTRWYLHVSVHIISNVVELLNAAHVQENVARGLHAKGIRYELDDYDKRRTYGVSDLVGGLHLLIKSEGSIQVIGVASVEEEDVRVNGRVNVEPNGTISNQYQVKMRLSSNDRYLAPSSSAQAFSTAARSLLMIARWTKAISIFAERA